MSDARHESRATVPIVDAVTTDAPSAPVDEKAFPYAVRPTVANVLSIDEVTMSFKEMHLPQLPAVKLRRRDAHGRMVEGAALSISMGCGQVASRQKLVEQKIVEHVPRALWPAIGAYHRTNGTMTGIINMLKICVARTNRASAANLPNEIRRHIEFNVPFYPLKTIEEYPAHGMRKLTLRNLFVVGDHKVSMNPLSDSGIWYRDVAKLQAPVNNEHAIKRAYGEVKDFLANLVVNVRDMPKFIRTAVTNEPMKYLVLAKPKNELCKVSTFDSKHRLIHVYPLWEQLVMAACAAVSWKRVLNFVEDPASPFMHNVGWHNGNAARVMERLLRLGEGFWGKNAGDDTGGIMVQLRVRPLTDAERGVVDEETLLDDALSARVAGVERVVRPPGYTYVDWDDNPIAVEKPWATEIPANVARTAILCMPDIERFDLSLLMSLWQKHVANATMSMTVDPSRILQFLITFGAFRYFSKDILFHRSAVERIANMGGAGYHWTTTFNSQIMACVNEQHRIDARQPFSTFDAEEGKGDPARVHNSYTNGSYTVSVHPNDQFVGPARVRAPRVVLTQESFRAWFTERAAIWEGVALRYKADSLETQVLDYKDPRVELPFLGHKILPWTYTVGKKTFRSYIAVYASPLKSLASLLNGQIRMQSDPGNPPPVGAILMSQAVCIALGNCTNALVHRVCKEVFETHAEADRTPHIDEGYLDGYAISDDINVKELLTVPHNIKRPAFPTMERLQAYSLPESLRAGMPPLYVAQSGVITVTSVAPTEKVDANPFAALEDAWSFNAPPADKLPVHINIPAQTVDRKHTGQLVETEEHKLKRKALLAEHARRKREAEMRRGDADARHFDQNAEIDAALDDTKSEATAYDQEEDLFDDILGKRLVEPRDDTDDPDESDDQWARRQDNYEDDALSIHTTYEVDDDDEMVAPTGGKLRGGGHDPMDLEVDESDEDDSKSDDTTFSQLVSRINAAIDRFEEVKVPDAPHVVVHIPPVDLDALSVASINTADEEREAYIAQQEEARCDEESESQAERDYDDDEENVIGVWLQLPHEDHSAHIIHVRADATVANFVSWVCAENGLWAMDVHFVHEGVPLVGGSLADHGVTDESTVRIYYRVRGGASDESIVRVYRRVRGDTPTAQLGWRHDPNDGHYTLVDLNDPTRYVTTAERHNPPPPPSDSIQDYSQDMFGRDRVPILPIVEYLTRWWTPTVNADLPAVALTTAAAIAATKLFVNPRYQGRVLNRHLARIRFRCHRAFGPGIGNFGEYVYLCNRLYEVTRPPGSRSRPMHRKGRVRVRLPKIPQNTNTNVSAAPHAAAATDVRLANSQSKDNMGKSSYSASTLNPTQDLRKGMREEIKEEVRKVGRSAARAVNAARKTVAESVRRNKPLKPKVRKMNRQYALTSPLRMGPLGIPRRKTMKNGDEIFRCSQLVGGGEIYGATGALVKVIDQPLNAGNSALWSKLSDRAKGFEMFQVQSIVLHYKATCTQLAPGMMLGYVEKDPTDLAVSTVRDIIENGTSFAANVYEADWNKQIDVPQRKCYVHMGNSMVTDDAEKRQDNPGVLRVFLDQVDSTALRGYLYMTYTVKLMNRRESVPEAINASADLVAFYGTFNTVEHSNQSAFYPLNVAIPVSNEGFGTYNWYLAGTADTQYPTLPHVSPATAPVAPRANAVYSATDTLGVAPSIERCAAFSVPAGQYLFNVRGTMGCGAAITGAGTGTLGVQYSLTDNVNAGFTSWTALGGGATAPSTNTTLPSASTAYSLTVTGTPGRYVAFRLVWENSDGTVSVTILNLGVRAVRNASSLDAARGVMASRTFQYPQDQAALSAALLDFTGEVILDAAAAYVPPLSIEERLAALEADDARSCVAIPPPKALSVVSNYSGPPRR